jgi:predicted nucleic acid-binding protein
MSYLFHTDTCSSIVRDVRLVASRSAQHAGSVHVCVISITGLELWLLRLRTPLRYRQKFFKFIHMVSLLDVTEPIAHRAAMLTSSLRNQGQKMGLADVLIAATAVERGLTLVTRKIPLFASISGLTIIDWSVP